MTTEQILQHIREVCGLKRVEFGCEVIIKDGDYLSERTASIEENETLLFVKNYESGIELRSKKDKTYVQIDKNKCELEIIGLPVHLENLLCAVRKKGSDICISPDGTMIDLDTSDGYEITYKVLPDYDLTRTVEQNLTENTELRELIISLIK